MERRLIPEVLKTQTLFHLGKDSSVLDAAKLMRDQNVGSVLVLEAGSLEGIFTERDVVQRVVADGLDPLHTLLGDVMTLNPDTISSDTTALDALRLMDDGGFRHLPIVDEGKVVGVISRRDFSGAEKARIDEENAIWERMG